MNRRVLRAMDTGSGSAALWSAALAGALDGSGPALTPLPTGPAAVRQALLDAFRPADAEAPLESDAIALVVPTSGSTGEPKGALLTAAALRDSAGATHARLGGPGRWVLALPLTHVAGLMVVVRSLETGQVPDEVDLTDGFDPVGFAAVTAAAAQAAAADAQPLYTSLVPTQLRRLLDAGVNLAGYAAILVGAAATPAPLLEQARDGGARVVTTYGMSETCGGCVYDGVPLDGAAFDLDPEGRVLLAGRTLFAGYRLRPDLTAAATDDAGRFLTGDLGDLGRDGRLRILGRADEVIVSGGENVAPAQVEAAVAAIPGVRACAVVGVPDDEWGEAVVALVVLEPAADPSPGPAPSFDLETLRSATAGRLPPAWRPRRLVLLATIPMLATGKPDRSALRDLAARDSASGSRPVPSTDPPTDPPTDRPSAPSAAQEL